VRAAPRGAAASGLAERRGRLRLRAVSGLDTLPPDQRAVLQLILVQGRGYADLASLLKLDLDAVRSRARAGVEGLGDAVPPARDALDAAQRARIADYLLGQQDDGERIVTFAELADSTAACRWAQALRDRLAAFAHRELPEVPAAAAANGRATGDLLATAAAPAALPTEAPTALEAPTAVAEPIAVAEPAPPAPAPPATRAAEQPPTAPPAPPAPPRAADARPDGPQPSRLGGALLLAGIVALAIVLAVVLIDGGDDDPSGSTGSTTTQTQTDGQTEPTRTTAQPTARIVAQVNLDATPAGGRAVGIGLVQRSGRTLAIAIEAQRLPANGAQDIYAVWLQGTGDTSRFLGFVPRQVRARGTFTVSAELPANARDYGTLLITREGTDAVPTAPGEQILSGALRLPA
jgi:outer membrane biosynthesis protein TonB